MSDVFAPAIEYILPLWEKCFDGAGPDFHVSIGGSKVEKPFEALVREAVESVDVSDLSTSAGAITTAMGQRARAAYRVEFNVPLEAWCVRQGVWDASKLLLDAFERLCGLVAADRTLGGIALHAQPYYSSIGTAARDKQYLAAISCGVRVKADIDPLQELD